MQCLICPMQGKSNCSLCQSRLQPFRLGLYWNPPQFVIVVFLFRFYFLSKFVILPVAAIYNYNGISPRPWCTGRPQGIEWTWGCHVCYATGITRARIASSAIYLRYVTSENWVRRSFHASWVDITSQLWITKLSISSFDVNSEWRCSTLQELTDPRWWPGQQLWGRHWN